MRWKPSTKWMRAQAYILSASARAKCFLSRASVPFEQSIATAYWPNSTQESSLFATFVPALLR